MTQAQTPYSPPLAPVRDPAGPAVPKPPAIGRSAICLGASAAVAVLSTAIALSGTSLSEGSSPAILTTAFTVGLLALVAIQLHRGRNWARWLFLVVYALGNLAFISGLVLAPLAYRALPPFYQAVVLVQLALQTAALVFMFTPASGRWMRSRT